MAVPCNSGRLCRILWQRRGGSDSRERRATFELVLSDEELFSEKRAVGSSILGKGQGHKSKFQEKVSGSGRQEVMVSIVDEGTEDQVD